MKIITTLFLILFLTLPRLAQAADGHFVIDNKGLGVPTSNNAEATVEIVLVNVIAIFFTIGGLGTVIYFIWGATDWVLSGGDKEKIAGARKKMTNAIIGLILLSLSYAIINIIGNVIGFNPLGALQIPGLGCNGQRAINQ